MPAFRPPQVTLTADIVIFTVREGRLEVLLIRRGNPPFQGCFALPGGIVEAGEDVDTCALRELEEETGVSGLELRQMHVFGAPGRDPRGHYVTVAYLTLVRPEQVRPAAASDAAEVAWLPIDDLPKLAFDHRAIVTMARRRLACLLEQSAAAFGYMPERFTMAELRILHETVRGETLDPRAFLRKMLALSLVEETGKTRKQGRRPVKLYRAVVRDGS